MKIAYVTTLIQVMQQLKNFQKKITRNFFVTKYKLVTSPVRGCMFGLLYKGFFSYNCKVNFYGFCHSKCPVQNLVIVLSNS